LELGNNKYLANLQRIKEIFTQKIVIKHWWRLPALVALTGTGGTVWKGATPSVEQPGGRGFKPRLRSLLD
jgi:hypothetical protein